MQINQRNLSLLLSYLLVAFSSAALASDGESQPSRAELKYLEIIKKSPRGNKDPIDHATRLPIIFIQAGHILVTDTDCEPYSRTFDNGINRKFSEDIYYSDKLCKQAGRLSELELINWLGEQQQTLLTVNSNGDLVYIKRYLFGGGQIPVLISLVNGQCTEAWCDYKWNSRKTSGGGETSYFMGKTDSELFTQFGPKLLLEEKAVQSLSDLPQGARAAYRLSLYDNVLMIADHKCYEVLKTGHRFIGEVFEVFKRPTHQAHALKRR